jgi:predicted RNA methylase
MSLVVDAHREFLSDAVRLRAYEAAICRHVRAGDVVVDLGAGSGILGLLACRAGASRVYAIEPSGLIELARAIAVENGVADRIRWIHQAAVEVTLPERADVLVGCTPSRHAGSNRTPASSRRASRFLRRASRTRWRMPTRRSGTRLSRVSR